jgi:hypothetical protein
MPSLTRNFLSGNLDETDSVSAIEKAAPNLSLKVAKAFVDDFNSQMGELTKKLLESDKKGYEGIINGIKDLQDYLKNLLDTASDPETKKKPDLRSIPRLIQESLEDTADLVRKQILGNPAPGSDLAPVSDRLQKLAEQLERDRVERHLKEQDQQHNKEGVQTQTSPAPEQPPPRRAPASRESGQTDRVSQLERVAPGSTLQILDQLVDNTNSQIDKLVKSVKNVDNEGYGKLLQGIKNLQIDLKETIARASDPTAKDAVRLQDLPKLIEDRLYHTASQLRQQARDDQSTPDIRSTAQNIAQLLGKVDADRALSPFDPKTVNSFIDKIVSQIAQETKTLRFSDREGYRDLVQEIRDLRTSLRQTTRTASPQDLPRLIEERLAQTVHEVRQQALRDDAPQATHYAANRILQSLNKLDPDEIEKLLNKLELERGDRSRNTITTGRSRSGVGAEIVSNPVTSSIAPFAVAAATGIPELALIVKLLEESSATLRTGFRALAAIPDLVESTHNTYKSLKEFLDPNSHASSGFFRRLEMLLGGKAAGSFLGGLLGGGGTLAEGAVGGALFGGLAASIGSAVAAALSAVLPGIIAGAGAVGVNRTLAGSAQRDHGEPTTDPTISYGAGALSGAATGAVIGGVIAGPAGAATGGAIGAVGAVGANALQRNIESLDKFRTNLRESIFGVDPEFHKAREEWEAGTKAGTDKRTIDEFYKDYYDIKNNPTARQLREKSPIGRGINRFSDFILGKPASEQAESPPPPPLEPRPQITPEFKAGAADRTGAVPSPGSLFSLVRPTPEKTQEPEEPPVTVTSGEVPASPKIDPILLVPMARATQIAQTPPTVPVSPPSSTAAQPRPSLEEAIGRALQGIVPSITGTAAAATTPTQPPAVEGQAVPGTGPTPAPQTAPEPRERAPESAEALTPPAPRPEVSERPAPLPPPDEFRRDQNALIPSFRRSSYEDQDTTNRPTIAPAALTSQQDNLSASGKLDELLSYQKRQTEILEYFFKQAIAAGGKRELNPFQPFSAGQIQQPNEGQQEPQVPPPAEGKGPDVVIPTPGRQELLKSLIPAAYQASSIESSESPAITAQGVSATATPNLPVTSYPYTTSTGVTTQAISPSPRIELPQIASIQSPISEVRSGFAPQSNIPVFQAGQAPQATSDGATFQSPAERFQFPLVDKTVREVQYQTLWNQLAGRHQVSQETPRADSTSPIVDLGTSLIKGPSGIAGLGIRLLQDQQAPQQQELKEASLQSNYRFPTPTIQSPAPSIPIGSQQVQVPSTEEEAVAQASQMMSPATQYIGSAVKNYAADVASGKVATNNLQQLSPAVPWNPELSPLENARRKALDPKGIDQAASMVLGLGNIGTKIGVETLATFPPVSYEPPRRVTSNQPSQSVVAAEAPIPTEITSPSEVQEARAPEPGTIQITPSQAPSAQTPEVTSDQAPAAAPPAQPSTSFLGSIGSTIGSYLGDVLHGRVAQRGLQQFSAAVPYNQDVSPLQNARAMARDPRAIEQATSIALSAGPGSIRAFHGGPYDFAKFDISKIGTGEGAQAYGHGLYFAEKEAVAKQYRKELSPRKLSDIKPDEIAVEKFKPALDDVYRRMNELPPEYVPGQSTQERTRHILRRKRELASLRKESDAIDQEMRKDTLDRSSQVVGGRVYEVNINAEPERLIHWDKPLSEQQNVSERAPHVDLAEGATGKDYYRKLSETLGGDDKATAALRDAGIPGIRYLDQVSRGVGKGTHNVVAFDDKLVEIIRKYGIAGILGGGGAAALLGGTSTSASAQEVTTINIPDEQQPVIESTPPQSEEPPIVNQALPGELPLAIPATPSIEPQPVSEPQPESSFLGSIGSTIKNYFRDVVTGQVAKRGLEQFFPAVSYDQNVSPLQNVRAMARDPRAIEQATSIALSAGPGSIRAFHGSPHSFEKFDISKIGTGEGAQAYGHGLYFAENEAVARSYRDNVKDMAMVDANNRRMAEVAKEMETLKKPGTYREFREPRGYQLAEEYDRLMEQKLAPGNMYEVNINAEPHQLLDWDKPLREHPQEVRNAFYQAGQTYVSPTQYASGALDHLTGSEAYSQLSKDLFDHPPTASEVLDKSGIPGIRYFDQASRTINEGTRNYVAFNPDTVEILRKYGIATLLGGAGSAGALAGTSTSASAQESQLADGMPRAEPPDVTTTKQVPDVQSEPIPGSAPFSIPEVRSPAPAQLPESEIPYVPNRIPPISIQFPEPGLPTLPKTSTPSVQVPDINLGRIPETLPTILGATREPKTNIAPQPVIPDVNLGRIPEGINTILGATRKESQSGSASQPVIPPINLGKVPKGVNRLETARGSSPSAQIPEVQVKQVPQTQSPELRPSIASESRPTEVPIPGAPEAQVPQLQSGQVSPTIPAQVAPGELPATRTLELPTATTPQAYVPETSYNVPIESRIPYLRPGGAVPATVPNTSTGRAPAPQIPITSGPVFYGTGLTRPQSDVSRGISALVPPIVNNAQQTLDTVLQRLRKQEELINELSKSRNKPAQSDRISSFLTLQGGVPTAEEASGFLSPGELPQFQIPQTQSPGVPSSRSPDIASKPVPESGIPDVRSGAVPLPQDMTPRGQTGIVPHYTPEVKKELGIPIPEQAPSAAPLSRDVSPRASILGIAPSTVQAGDSTPLVAPTPAPSAAPTVTTSQQSDLPIIPFDPEPMRWVSDPSLRSTGRAIRATVRGGHSYDPTGSEESIRSQISTPGHMFRGPVESPSPSSSRRSESSSGPESRTERVNVGSQTVSVAPAGVFESIARAEGTFGKSGINYDDMLGHPGGVLGAPPKPISQMTVKEVIDWQGQMLQHPENKWNSSAVGAFQITRQNLRGQVERGILDPNETFGAEAQQRAASTIWKEQGSRAWEGFKANEGLRKSATELASSGQWTPVSTTESRQASDGSNVENPSLESRTVNVGSGQVEANREKSPQERAAAAVDDLKRMAGTPRDSAALKDYLQTGGVNLNPSKQAWCAAVVNAALQNNGLQGTGSNIASMGALWKGGTQVPLEQSQKGDLAIAMNDTRPGEVGAHAVLLTGERRENPKTRQIEYETIGRNQVEVKDDRGRVIGHQDLVAPRWRSDIIAMHPTETQSPSPNNPKITTVSSTKSAMGTASQDSNRPSIEYPESSGSADTVVSRVTEGSGSRAAIVPVASKREASSPPRDTASILKQYTAKEIQAYTARDMINPQTGIPSVPPGTPINSRGEAYSSELTKMSPQERRNVSESMTAIKQQGFVTSDPAPGPALVKTRQEVEDIRPEQGSVTSPRPPSDLDIGSQVLPADYESPTVSTRPISNELPLVRPDKAVMATPVAADEPLNIESPTLSAHGMESINASLRAVDEQVSADAELAKQNSRPLSRDKQDGSDRDIMGGHQFKSFTVGDVALTYHSGEGL